MDISLRNIKPSIFSWVMVGLMAISFIVLAKFVVNQYDNVLTRYVRDVVNTA